MSDEERDYPSDPDEEGEGEEIPSIVDKKLTPVFWDMLTSEQTEDVRMRIVLDDLFDDQMQYEATLGGPVAYEQLTTMVNIFNASAQLAELNRNAKFKYPKLTREKLIRLLKINPWVPLSTARNELPVEEIMDIEWRGIRPEVKRRLEFKYEKDRDFQPGPNVKFSKEETHQREQERVKAAMTLIPKEDEEGRKLFLARIRKEGPWTKKELMKIAAQSRSANRKRYDPDKPGPSHQGKRS